MSEVCHRGLTSGLANSEEVIGEITRDARGYPPRGYLYLCEGRAGSLTVRELS
jgi:hypothetical protein